MSAVVISFVLRACVQTLFVPGTCKSHFSPCVTEETEHPLNAIHMQLRNYHTCTHLRVTHRNAASIIYLLESGHQAHGQVHVHVLISRRWLHVGMLNSFLQKQEPPLNKHV